MHRIMLNILLLTVAAVPAFAQGTLIPVAGRRAHVYDVPRHILHIGTSSGTIERYDTVQQQLLTPFGVGNVLNGLDLTPDGAAIYVTDSVPGPTDGFVYKVDPDDGTFTTLTYNLDFAEGGGWKLVIANNGLGFLTTQFNGSGWTPLRAINLATDTFKKRRDAPGSGGNGQVRQNTGISRGGDRSLLFFTESNISSGPIFDYDAPSDTFPTQADTNTFLDGVVTAVNRDGTLIALELFSGLAILDRNFGSVTTIAGIDGGVIFDPIRDQLYGVDSVHDEIVIVDTTTFSELGRLTIGENVPTSATFDEGEMSMGSDGVFLFLSTPAGIRMFNIGPPVPSVLSVAPFRTDYKTPSTPVTIAGRYFTHGSTPAVSFGGVAATDVLVVDDTTLTCTAPAGVPGPVEVSVRNENGDGLLPQGFVYTPALLMSGDLAPGGTLELDYLLTAGDAVFAIAGAPPQASIDTPPYDGELCIPLFLSFFFLPKWPLDDLDLTLDIPDNPALSGQEVLLQALIGRLSAKQGAWTNCATVVFQ